ncbi:MAG: EamA family transporter [Bradyrhizobium sp.]|nr:EamA family transporter [Bradyrhizobium sp.]
MSKWSFVLVLFSVTLSSGAQLLLKAGMTSDVVQRALTSGRGLSIIPGIATSPQILAGLAIFALSVLTWLFVLSKVDVSQAYPAVAFGIVVTALGGYFFFGEALNSIRILGIIIVIIGVAVVAAS